MIKKELYAAPTTEVLELRLEGTVLTGSNVSLGIGLDNAYQNDGTDEDW